MSETLHQARKASGPSALFLIEEAMHLLRQAPATDLCWYYAGGVPWVLGLLGFWAHASWFAPSGAQIAWGALLLVLLFGWLKFCQAMFAARLLARRRGVGLPRVGGREALDTWVRQLRVHSWGLLALPVAAVLTAPMAYVWTYYQTLTVTDGVGLRTTGGARVSGNLGAGGIGQAGEAGSNRGVDAWELAKLWPMQTHVGMMILSLLVLVGWLNLAGAFLLLPYLATRFLGVENLFGMSDWAMFNTTFFASTVASAWLAVDPLFKAYHVVRSFHGRALTGGEDLREAFLKTGGRRLLMLMVFLSGLGFGVAELKASAPAEEAGRAGHEALREPVVLAKDKAAAQPVAYERSTTLQRVAAQDLKASIEQRLQSSDFAWRLKTKPVLDKSKQEGPVVRFIKVGIEMVKEVIDTVRERFRSLKRWWKRLFGMSEDEAVEAAGNRSESSVVLFKLFTYVLGGLLLLVLAYLCYVVVRQARLNARRRVFAKPSFSPLATPDLRDETVHAAQLPSEGWLTLAREKLGAGEWRLAFRALYLAQLAALAEQGFLSLARHKTNQDYEGELRRRQPQRSELLDTFGRRRRGFDAVWYGHDEATEAELRDWLSELERRDRP